MIYASWLTGWNNICIPGCAFYNDFRLCLPKASAPKVEPSVPSALGERKEPLRGKSNERH